MMFSYARPALTFTAPAGGAILTDQARLTNEKPRSKTQLRWTSGAQTTATTMTLQVEWTGAISPRVVAIMGASLPAGLPVAIKVWNGAAFVTPAAPNNGTIVQRPDGRAFAIVLPDGITASTKAQLIMTNNIGGSTVLAGDDLFTLGEGWVAGGEELVVINDWQPTWEDSTKYQWSFDQQASKRAGKGRRVFTFTPKLMDEDDIFGSDTDPAALDLDMLLGNVLEGAPVLCIPRYTDTSGAYSNRLAARTATFGVATQMPSFPHLAGPNYKPGAMKITAPAIY